jgi:hypothetical protein
VASGRSISHYSSRIKIAFPLLITYQDRFRITLSSSRIGPMSHYDPSHVLLPEITTRRTRPPDSASLPRRRHASSLPGHTTTSANVAITYSLRQDSDEFPEQSLMFVTPKKKTNTKNELWLYIRGGRRRSLPAPPPLPTCLVARAVAKEPKIS